jgi:hypothetical protein
MWAKEDGYWKIVSWQTEAEPDETLWRKEDGNWRIRAYDVDLP